jgi:hypothetical protein
MYNELVGVDIPAEIAYLVKNDSTLDERLVHLLEDVATATESIALVNLFVLRYILGEVSQLDLRIALNKYKVSKQSVVD